MTDYTQLIRDCQNGNGVAQKQLYESFAGTMLGVCYRYTKSMEDAEDVLQEGFIRVFRYLHQYKKEGEFGGWIRRIMVTTAINYLKKNRHYQVELAYSEADTSMHPVSKDAPDLKLAAREVASLIRQLPTGYQTIFNLYAVEGYTHEEIGKMMGISNVTSRSQYSRARALLITWLEKEEQATKRNNYAG